MSGLIGGLIRPRTGDWTWRAEALLGLVLAPSLARLLFQTPAPTIGAGAPEVIVAALLVGFGTRLGNGCASGHGVCGSASRRARWPRR